jgi:hypothetical protein
MIVVGMYDIRVCLPDGHHDLRAEMHRAVRGNTPIPTNRNPVPSLPTFPLVSRIGSNNSHLVTSVDKPLGNLLDVCLDTAGLRWIPWRHLQNIHPYSPVSHS